jgi:hypothetical protein
MEPDIEANRTDAPAESSDSVTGGEFEQSAPAPTTDATTRDLATLEESDRNNPIEKGLLWGYRISEAIETLPSYFNYFISAYKQPLKLAGLLLVGVVVIRVAIALLGALHGIPLLALIFKTIGLGYLIWFVIRYWLKAETRRELYDTVNTWIDLVLGTSEASDSDAQ